MTNLGQNRLGAIEGCHTMICSKPLRLVRHEALESRTDVGLGYMDIVSLSNLRGAMAHQPRQSVSIHAAFHAPGSERVAPGVERK